MALFAQFDHDVEPDPSLHGGKGAGVLAMHKAGMPVPEALILTTEAWYDYRKTGKLSPPVKHAIITFLKNYPGSMFSVRSGAPISMPGMMDTVLNVGVNDELDHEYEGAYRRFATSWLSIVKGVNKERLNTLMDQVNARSQGNTARFRKLLHGVVQAAEHVSIPDSREDQVLECVKAVFDSWDTPRAKAYREMHNIPESMGTACVIQRMVMGTAPGFSGSGVMFSRDPATGEAVLRGEFAMHAQGEEVVSGEVTPKNIEELPLGRYEQLRMLADHLESIYGDVQDIEFTYESGNLYVLQTRVAKMSARARIVTACELSTHLAKKPEQRLDFLRARVSRDMVAKTKVPMVKGNATPAATGLAASPGAFCGRIVTRKTPLSDVDKNCILVAEDTAPEDFPIMAKAGAILTKTGGFTCHSAVVARGIGVPAVVGCEEMKFSGNSIEIGGYTLKPSMKVTIDGTTGKVFAGEHEVSAATPPRILYTTLHSIFEGLKGKLKSEVPEGTYLMDCGLGDRILLPVNPADLDAVDRQLQRAAKMQEAGKEVAFGFEVQGLGEDLIDNDPKSVFANLAAHYGPDFKEATVVYGVPTAIIGFVEESLGCHVSTDEVQVMDLLDLLGE